MNPFKCHKREIMVYVVVQRDTERSSLAWEWLVWHSFKNLKETFVIEKILVTCRCLISPCKRHKAKTSTFNFVTQDTLNAQPEIISA